MKKLIVIALFTFGAIFGQENNFKKYLSEHKSIINLDNNNQWELLKSDALLNQFIILGEPHGAKNAQLIDFNLLKYLNATVGTKTYIAEMDYAQATAINEFLETGKKEELKSVFRYWIKIHAQWGNQDFYDKILKIRELNLSLPKDKRISFAGIDGVQDLKRYLTYLNSIIKKSKSPLFADLQKVINYELTDSQTEKIGLFAQKYYEEIQQNKAEFEKILKLKLPVFEYLIQNLSYISTKPRVSRPEQLFRNYKQLYSILKLENQKLYGMWGYFHAHLIPVEYIGEDFASKLASSDHISSKKIISVVCFPIDSKFNVWNSKTGNWSKEPFSYDSKSLLEIDGIEDLKALSTESSTTLFKLNGTNSPFVKTGKLFNGIAPQGKLTGNFKNRDYAFQYVVLMRNSDWLTPLSNDF